MFCTNCGREAEGKFCTYCGAQLLVDADPNAQDNASQQPASQIPEPVFDGASASDSSQPQAQQPAAPVPPPVQPVQPPVQPVQPPVQPVQPPQKQKKPMGAGKIVLIVLLSLLAVVILLVAACWGLASKLSNSITDSDFSQYLSDLESAVEEVEPIDSATPDTPDVSQATGSDLVYYEGLLYLTVDQASYDGANIVADVTLWNDCDFGIGAIEDLMVNLYDASGTHVAYGSFFFDGAYDDPAGIIPSGSYTEMTLTFGPNEGDSVTPDMDLSSLDASFEVMCRMYDENEELIGERVETRLFAICLPVEWVDTVDYYVDDVAYHFYSIANSRAGYGGELFAIEYYEEDGAWDDDAEYLGSDAWYYYAASYPDTQQYDPTSPVLSQEYEALQEQIDRVLYTINIF